MQLAEVVPADGLGKRKPTEPVSGTFGQGHPAEAVRTNDLSQLPVNSQLTIRNFPGSQLHRPQKKTAGDHSPAVLSRATV